MGGLLQLVKALGGKEADGARRGWHLEAVGRTPLAAGAVGQREGTMMSRIKAWCSRITPNYRPRVDILGSLVLIPICIGLEKKMM